LALLPKLGQLVEQAENQILTPRRANLPPGFRLELQVQLIDSPSRTVSVSICISVYIYLLLVALYRSFFLPASNCGNGANPE